MLYRYYMYQGDTDNEHLKVFSILAKETSPGVM